MDIPCNIATSSPDAPEFILDMLSVSGRPLPIGALCRGGSVMGLQPRTIRVAVTRLLQEQKIKRPARATYALDPNGLPLINTLALSTPETRQRSWSGSWIAVQDGDVRRSDKVAWRRHQLALSLRGFAELAKGFRLRSDNRVGGIDREVSILREIGLAPQARVFIAVDFDKETDQAVRDLWPVQRLEREYLALSKALAAHQAILGDLLVETAVRESLLLGRTSAMRLSRDPDLPEALMSQVAYRILYHRLTTYRRLARKVWLAWLKLP